MTAQVLFFPVKYTPSPEKKIEMAQAELDVQMWRARIDYLSRDFTQFQKFIFKESAHNQTRQKWLVFIDGVLREQKT